MKPVFKWVEIARSSTPLRYDVLSKYLKSKGFENELTYVEVSPQNFSEELQKAMKTHDAIRLASPYGLQVIEYFQNQKIEIININAADSIIKQRGEWTLISSNLEGFHHVVRKNGPNINLNSSVLIVGAGAAARFAIHSLAQIGIKKFKISNQFQEQAKSLIEELRKKYFTVSFDFIPEDQLVLLPGSNSVVVNTTPLVPSNNILKELYYFNFLRPDGLVIDFTFLPLLTPLIKEANDIGIKTIRGYEICGWGDIQWAKTCLDADLDFEEYCFLLLEAGTQWDNEQKEKADLEKEDEEEKAVKNGPMF